MDVAIIVSTLAGLSLAIAKALMEEQQRAKRQTTAFHSPPNRESKENREHI